MTGFTGPAGSDDNPSNITLTIGSIYGSHHGYISPYMWDIIFVIGDKVFR